MLVVHRLGHTTGIQWERGQEGVRRANVSPSASCACATVCALARAALHDEPPRIATLRDRLLTGLQTRIANLAVNGPLDRRLPGNLSVRFPSIHALDLIAACPLLAVSTGSACTSADIAPSHVLTALGLPEAEAATTLRLSIGRFTSPADIDNAVHMLADAYAALAQARRALAKA